MMKKDVKEISLRDLVNIVVKSENCLLLDKMLSNIVQSVPDREAKIVAFRDFLDKLYREIDRREKIYERGYE